MKTITRFAFAASLLVYCSLAQPVAARTISVNLYANSNPASALAPTDISGVPPYSNWNNVTIAGGTPVAGGFEATATGLKTDQGHTTGINFRIYGTPNDEADNVSGVGPNETMMQYGVRTSYVQPDGISSHGADTRAGQLEFTNLINAFPRGYDVYLYLGETHPQMGSAGGPGMASFAGPDSGIFISGSGYTNHIADDIPAGASIVPYRTAVSSNGEVYFPDYNFSSGVGDPGNYVKILYSNFDTLVITTVAGAGTSNDGAGGENHTVAIMGVQIVGLLPEPSSLTLAALALIALGGFGFRRRRAK